MRSALNGPLDGSRFKTKAVSAYPGLDFNFDIPSDEEGEGSFSPDYSGEPNTPVEARSPSSSSDI